MTLGTLISEGKVELTEQEHAEIQTNVANIIEISETEVDLLFNQFEEDFSKFIESTKQMVKTADEKRSIAERRANDLQIQNQKWINKTQSMINKLHSYNIV